MDTPTAAVLLNNARMADATGNESLLSSYIREWTVSKKRRYIEKILGIQDPYLI